jgi:hypothetical protein
MYLDGHLSGIKSPTIDSLAVCNAELFAAEISTTLNSQPKFQIKCRGGHRLLPPAESGLVGARDVISQQFWPVSTLSPTQFASTC